MKSKNRSQNQSNSKNNTLKSAELVLKGKTKGFKGVLPFLGPAFIASVAYIDPGNFATNIAAGSEYGYLLLWVIAISNLMAVLIQSMSAKLGIATGRNLPEVSREHFPKLVNHPITTTLAWGVSALIITLNFFLLYQTI